MVEIDKSVFCDKEVCLKFKEGKCVVKSPSMDCFKTAKQFFNWVEKNKYKIVKE